MKSTTTHTSPRQQTRTTSPAAAPVPAPAPVPADAPAPAPAAVVRAQRFELTDDQGRVRARLSMQPTVDPGVQTPALELRSADGLLLLDARLVCSEGREYPNISLATVDGIEVLSFEVSPETHQPVINVPDHVGVPLARIARKAGLTKKQRKAHRRSFREKYEAAVRARWQDAGLDVTPSGRLVERQQQT